MAPPTTRGKQTEASSGSTLGSDTPIETQDPQLLTTLQTQLQALMEMRAADQAQIRMLMDGQAANQAHNQELLEELRERRRDRSESRSRSRRPIRHRSLSDERPSHSRENTPAPTVTITRTKSSKFPDPPALGKKGEHPTFESWEIQMKGKFHVNADHFDDENAKMFYVFSCTKDDA